MKILAKALKITLLTVLIVLVMPAAKAEYVSDFDGLAFRSAAGFYTVIVDTEGEEYLFDGILDLSGLENDPEILRIASYRICFEDAVVMDVVLREFEVKKTEPGVTGAVGNLMTNGYYAVSFDISGEYEAFLTGLTLENLEQVQVELIAALLEGRDFEMTHLDFIDTEKNNGGEGENRDLCWAAACSNVLHYTGWAQAANPDFATPDDVFEVYIEAFDPAGGHAAFGIPWFFGGINHQQGVSGWAQVDNTEEYAYGTFNGFFPEYAVDNFLTDYQVDIAPRSIELVFEALRGGSGSTIAFGWYDGNWDRWGGHAISLWGYVQRKDASGFDKSSYYALIVSDSDSDYFYDERRRAPNNLWMLTMDSVVTRNGDDSWVLNGYNSSLYAMLESFQVLKPYRDDYIKEEGERADKFDGVAKDIMSYLQICNDTEETLAFSAGDTVTIRIGCENVSQFDWTATQAFTVTYVLTNQQGETLIERPIESSAMLGSGERKVWRTTITPAAGEYTVTVTVSLADPNTGETYYTNNTRTCTFTVVPRPETTMNAAIGGEDGDAISAVIDFDNGAPERYDIYELSVSYLEDDVWSDWITVFAGRDLPETCPVLSLGTAVKIRMEAEYRGVVSHHWESEEISLERTVTFDPNGGTVSIASKTVLLGDVYGELPVPTKANQAGFEGWYTEPEGGTKITAETRYLLRGDVTLYAHWTEITHTLENGGDLRALLASGAVKDGDTIVLSGTGFVNDSNSDSAPWVIDKAITIRGGTLNLRAGGILLAADVTLDGVNLMFANPVRNAILANGYTLKLKNVCSDSSTNAVHLFCGGLTGHSVTAAEGEHGHIMILGSTSLGNIYAGSMSADGGDHVTAMPATVTVDHTATGKMGEFFACGALESYVDPDEMLNPGYTVAAPTADASRFVVSGAVRIDLYQNVIMKVDAATGGDANAFVTFNGTGNLCELTLTNVGGLAVESGYLVLKGAGMDSEADLAVTVGAQLGLSELENLLVVGNFAGGGTVILGEEQTMVITGTVSGTTSVGIGGVFNGASEGKIKRNHAYLSAVNSEEGSFVLLPPKNNPAAVFERDENGDWFASGAMAEIVLESASVSEKVTVESGSTYAYIPVTVSYLSDLSLSSLGGIPMEITVNGVTAECVYDEEYGYYYYLFPENFSMSDAEFFVWDEVTELLMLNGNEEQGSIPDGEYAITMVIDSMYTGNGETITLTVKLIVGEESEPGEIIPGTAEVEIVMDSSTGRPWLTWDAVPGAEKYEIWRAVGDGAFVRVGVTEETEYCDADYTAGTTHFYMVRAVSGNASGAFSDIVMIFEVQKVVAVPPRR